MEESPPVRRPSRRWLRRILAAMFLLALATLGFRAGYRRGYEPKEIAAQLTSNSLIRKVYPVADLVIPVGHQETGSSVADFDSLIDLIVSTIERDSWMENGMGSGEIQPFPANKSLVISQTQRVHHEIGDLLEQLRRFQNEVTAEQTISLFQSWAANGTENSHGFQKFPVNAEGRRALAQYFDKSLQNVVDVWGSPTFHGKREKQTFPSGRRPKNSPGGREAQGWPTFQSNWMGNRVGNSSSAGDLKGPQRRRVQPPRFPSNQLKNNQPRPDSTVLLN